MKAPVLLLALSCCSTVALARGSHDAGRVAVHARDHRHDPSVHGMQLLRKRQQTATTPAAAATGSDASSASSPAAASSSSSSPLDSLTNALNPASSASSSSSSSSSSASSEPDESQQHTSSASSAAVNSPSSSTALATPARESTASNVASSSETSEPSQSVTRPTVVSIVTPSSRATDASASTHLSSSSTTSSSSTASAADSKSSSSGGISHATLIAIIVVASCVGGIAAIWTIIRKTKFSPSKRFESKLEPIDFVPEVPVSGPYGGRGTGAAGGYEASLARSDSKGSYAAGGVAMSESGDRLASIPYQGPSSMGGYGGQPYYAGGGANVGEVYPSPPLGYPHEQPNHYPSLQRGPSSSSLLHQQQGNLGRMNTTGGVGAYDYAAQARSQSRTGAPYPHHQYY
ncbi:uncharacterized protein JCM15063_002880 [Sporobolomyces koalae]|uniref:uncharacterized protein n=1 Tax=Sporobolomyces koalae TaxID=500713 RepID=UPI00316BEA79